MLLPFGSPPIQTTAVTPGSYTNTNVTVNKYGQVTAASNGSGGGTTVNINTLKIDQTGGAGSPTYGLLAGTVNGSNKVFTVSNTAYVSGSLMVFLNGQDLTQGTDDWQETTPASGTFTFTTAPPTGSIIQAVYITQSTTTSSGNAPVILSTTNSISGTTIANTALFTVPTGKVCVVTGYVVRVSTATAITNGPAAGIGNIAGTNNISASQAMNLLISTTTTFLWAVDGMSALTPAAGVVYYNQGTGATGTSETLSVDLMGYTL